ncbi:MMP9 [Lepeophtheirus salmonis]|uniref:MMP9 n=2 Tax=Lepeophtheirus salmonis TaxID=72036 RepID=A0A7R8HE75_LEPSM|nr:MMP9 [Lepeophtheirus salmonis]CAF3024342.1 MMP9 [Lepeophtheirus salmonis]
MKVIFLIVALSALFLESNGQTKTTPAQSIKTTQPLKETPTTVITTTPTSPPTTPTAPPTTPTAPPTTPTAPPTTPTAPPTTPTAPPTTPTAPPTIPTPPPKTVAPTTITTTMPTTVTPLACGTVTGNPCIFPFIYAENIYVSCTTTDNGGIPWCATTLYPTGFAHVYDTCNSACATEQTNQPNTCKTVTGRNCLPGFDYNDISYPQCTTAGDTRAWCATSLYLGTNEALEWEYCNSACSIAPTPASTTCQTLEQQPCLLPFMYNGVMYTKCTDVDNGGVKWCATSVDSTNSAVGWGNCQSTSACN